MFTGKETGIDPGGRGNPHMISRDLVDQFGALLRDHEKSNATIEKYTRDVRTFIAWLDEADAAAAAEQRRAPLHTGERTHRTPRPGTAAAGGRNQAACLCTPGSR